jgi:2-polyprenyl-3-methyl-5-hydroxy-6-metoxy-1,4-benzoquinol methylase
MLVVVPDANWTWDETLYAGSAAHYAAGRMAYPAALASALVDALGLDGTGRLLDVGCGPGSLTLLLAPHVSQAVGVDADAGMLEVAARRAAAAGVRNAQWHRLRAEELPAGLGAFRTVTFAQSFHWMDQALVAERVRAMLEPGGVWVHVRATTHQGVPGDEPLPAPRPPWDAVHRLIEAYLGATPRAGQVVLLRPRSGEEDVLRAAGYRGPQRLRVGQGQVVRRSEDQVVAAVFSLSRAAPHLFGDRVAGFERDLRAVLRETSPTGVFAEQVDDIDVVIWRP